MRIQAKQLSDHLKNTLTAVYFIYGEDPLQRMEALDAILAKARNQGFGERLIYELKTTESDWDSLKNEYYAQSLFSEKRIFDCRLNDGKIGKKGSECLLELLQATKAPSEDTLFIFSLHDKPEAQIMKSAWFTALERVGTSVIASTPKGKAFAEFIEQRLKNAGLDHSPETVDWLHARTEGNTLALAQAVEKLALMGMGVRPDNSCSLKLEDCSLSASTRFTLYDLADTALSGSIERTLQIFSSLKSEGVESILILWVLTREVRNIIPLAKLAETGKLNQNTLREKGVWQHRIGLISTFLKRCSLSSLYHLLKQARNIDHLIKSNRQTEAWGSLLSLSLQIAGVQDG